VTNQALDHRRHRRRTRTSPPTGDCPVRQRRADRHDYGQRGAWSTSITLSGDGGHTSRHRRPTHRQYRDQRHGWSDARYVARQSLGRSLRKPGIVERRITRTRRSPVRRPNATVYDQEGATTLGASTANDQRWIFTPAGFVDGVHTLTAARRISPVIRERRRSVLPQDVGADAFSLALSPTAEDNATTVMTPTIVGHGEPGDVLPFHDTAGRAPHRRPMAAGHSPRRDGGRAITISSPRNHIAGQTSGAIGSAHG